MANISQYLQNIMKAIYGEEVRGSIHDAIEAMNVESSRAMQFASTAKDSAQASANAAQSSASTASVKASEAASSANAAKSSETKAGTSAEAAKASEIAAKQSERAAKNSETSAASAAAASVQKANEAANAADAAKIFETNAGVSAANAARDASESSASEQKAKKSADDAASAAAAADSSSKAAAASANAAKRSEENAAESQTAAWRSETNAAGSAQAAKASESSAKDSERIVLANLEASLRYVDLLRAIDDLLADYAIQQILTDSDDDPILDGDGDHISAHCFGFDGFIRMVLELRVHVAENQERLRLLDALLAGYAIRQMLTDSDEDQILDSDGDDISVEMIGLDGLIRSVLELRVLAAENRERANLLEKRVLALEANHTNTP